MPELLSAPVRPHSRDRSERLAGTTQPFELRQWKLRAPPHRRGAVPRASLLRALEDSNAVPVVSIAAGPGWGKTTLLAHWRVRSNRPFAWISIDENDNDPRVLLSYVAAALDRISPLDGDVFEALASPEASVEGVLMPRVGAALGSLEEPAVVVLDDVHLLRDPRSLHAIADLRRHVPEGTQLVLSARGRPVLPLGRLRARGLVVEVGPGELRMGDGEAGQLLRGVGLDLAVAEITALTRRTEGWPAGLYLAARSLKAHGAVAPDVTAFKGDDRFVADYLDSELLSRLPPAQLQFLRQTAIFDRLSGPFCDAVLEVSDSAAILESLERSNLFVEPLDRNGQSYRCHQLVRELLRAQLERAEPDLVPQLLARATAWSEANGQPEAAIGYAQDAGDIESASRLVERCALPAYESGRVVAAERWLEWLEVHGALDENAAVAVIDALIASLLGRAADAERWADTAERATYDGVLPDGSLLVDSWLALLRAHQCRRGAARMRGDAELALHTVACDSPLRASASLLVATSHLIVGDVEEADDLFADVADGGLALGAVLEVVMALAQRAAIACGRGAWVQAEDFADRALEVMHRSGMDAYPTSAFVCAVAGRVALHRGEDERAQALLAQARELRVDLTHALPYLAVQTRLELARAGLANMDTADAETMLHEIEAILRRRPDLGGLVSQADELRTGLETIHRSAPGAPTLTTAELRILPWLATQLSFREMGERIYLSRHTVKSHAMAIYRKLNATSRTAAVDRARELGLLRGEGPSGGDSSHRDDGEEVVGDV